ncbi:MAG: hypothetical protein ACRYGO_19035 [Janthinobacterium lividum]
MRIAARSLYKAFGAAIAWELERRWSRVGIGHFAGSLLTDLGSEAQSVTSHIKQFGRWKQWYTDDSSFASGDPEMLVDVIGWCRYRTLIQLSEEQKLREALLPILQFSMGTVPFDTFLKALPHSEGVLREFLEIERIPEKKTMFVDRRQMRKFRRSDLTVNAPRGIRLTEDGRRWKALEAAVVGLEKIEQLVRLGERASRAAANWQLPSNIERKLIANTSEIIEQLFSVLNGSPLSQAQEFERAMTTIDELALHMRSKYEELHASESKRSICRSSRFEKITFTSEM